jgi:alpha-tubulin suppressor-like RCC1 family protein
VRPLSAGTVAAGASHTLVLKTTDKSLWAWGLNSDGQLGDNSTTQRKTPVQVTTLSSVAAVAAGAKHSLALKTDGTLWAWGDNQYGQVGNGNTTDQKVPKQVMTGVSLVAAGDYHSIALKSDGTVWSWGRNSDGQLGDGGTTNRSTPAQVTGLGLVNAIGGGGSHTLVVLAAGGPMKAWGKNADAQLGDGTTTRATNPVSVSGVMNATATAGGSASSVERKNDGTLLAWGQNADGQLGLGDTAQRTTATTITGLSSLSTMAAGGFHVVALLSGGTVAAWGHNTYGSVGDGSTTQRTSPIAISGLASIAAVGAGRYHSLAVTTTGEVWAWGYNNAYQLGDGTTANRTSPVKIADAGFAWKVATPTFNPVPGTYGANQSVTIACATSGATIRYTTDGTDPTTSSTQYSAAISVTVSRTLKARGFKTGLSNSNVSTGVYTLQAAPPTFSPVGGTYTAAQTVTITTATTGATIRYTTDGSEPTGSSAAYAAPLGVGTTTTLKAAAFKTGWTTSGIAAAGYTMNFGPLSAPALSPSPATYLDSVSVAITATAGATIRYTTDGSDPVVSSALYTSALPLTQTTVVKAAAWKVDYTQSPTTSGLYLLKVAPPLLSLPSGTYSAGSTVTVTSATAGATLHYTTNGSDPTEQNPSLVSGGSIAIGSFVLKVRAFKAGCDPSDITSAAYAVGAAAMSGGTSFSLGLTPSGIVYSWGDNASYQLGDGTGTGRTLPMAIAALTDVTAIAAGATHALALTRDGAVWSWGTNGVGQLGDGTKTTRPVPVRLGSLTDVVAVGARGSVSAALKRDGTLWMWGNNADGQIGVGSTAEKLSPVQVMADAAEIAIGGRHCVARKTDGSTWAWGYNYYGQLGDGTTTTRFAPVSVTLGAAVRVAAGDSHSLALRSDGTIWSWGNNYYGQLGDGTTTPRGTPARVPGLLGLQGLAAGADFSLVSRIDGSVWIWGRNDSGQLGDGTLVDRTSPYRLPGLAGIATVTAGSRHAFAVDGAGAVWTWGSNPFGQLGDGTTKDRFTPVSLADVGYAWRAGTPLFDHAAGTYSAAFSLAVTTASTSGVIRYSLDGSDPTVASAVYSAPLSLTASTVVRARTYVTGMPESNSEGVALVLKVVPPTYAPAGGTYASPQTVAISTTTSGATIRYTTNGQRPDESSTAYPGPLSISTQTTLQARAFKAGWTGSDVRGSAYTFNLGTLPAPVITPPAGTYPAPLNVTLSGTSGATIRFTTDGTEPTPTSPAYAAPITLNSNANIKAKAFQSDWTASGTSSATFVVKLANPTFSLGPGSYPVGQPLTLSSPDPSATIRYTLDGSAPGPASTGIPSGSTVNLMRGVTIKAAAHKANCDPSDVVSAAFTVTGSLPSGIVVAGDTHSVAVTTDGLLWAWGDNTWGRLGDGTYDGHLVPSRVTWSGTANRIAAGAAHTLAIDSAGVLKAWGYNGWGQLGDGTPTHRTLPVATSGLAAGAVAAIAAGQNHSLAALTDGTVAAWGSASNGQLGDGSTGWRGDAGTVPGLSGVVRVAAAAAQSFAVKGDGTVLAWGQNGNGQLGDGSRTPRPTPVSVAGLSGVTAVAAGVYHTLALTSSGAVYSWGFNGYGQLGDGSRTEKLTPGPVPGLTGVVAIAAGAHHSLALRSDGTIWVWGYNAWGQLGDGTNWDRLSPTLVGPVRKAIAIGAGGTHSLTLTQDGVLWAWGANASGQIGDGSRYDRSLPVALSAAGGTWNVAAPTFNRASSTYASEIDVIVSCATPGATIHYTLNGADPALTDPTVASGSAVHVAASVTLKARAFLGGQSSTVAAAAYTLSLNPPQFSPCCGPFGADVDLAISATAGATIRFTLDGSDPTDTSTAYAAPIHISQPQTLKARAVRTGWTTSSVTAVAFAMKVATPSLVPGGGTYTAVTNVSAATTTPGALIRYTLDGADPAPDSPVLSGGQIAVDHSATLRVRAWRAGWTSSDGAVATFSVTKGQAAAPTMDPPAGTYSQAQKVTLNAAPGAVVRYTFDGTAPTWSSAKYSRPIAVGETTTLKAKAWLADSLESPVTTADYTLDLGQALAPRLSVVEGRYATRRLVTVTCPTAGSTVRYTTTGADPTTSDAVIACDADITISRSAILKARAWKVGLSASAVRQATFEISGMVAAGGLHSLALDADGRVWAWGYNASGQLGDGANVDRLVPYQLPAYSASPVAFISAGYTHSLAVTEDGRVWAWGSNDSGQLGDGTQTQRNSPVQLLAFSVNPVVAVSAGQSHSLALTADGRVWGWGSNYYGQVGDGTQNIRTSPVQLAPFPTAPVIGIAAGALHSLAITGDGRAWAWGLNNSGEIGDGTGTLRTAPVPVVSLARVVQIAAGSHGNHSVALTSDGVVWAWGSNGAGQLGDSTATIRYFPVRVSGLRGPLSVAAGSQVSIASTLDDSGVGALLSWGSNASGLLGDASAASSRRQPGRVAGLANAFSVASSDQFLLAIGLDGAVWGWGANSGGQLGIGTRSPSNIPARVSGLILSDSTFLTSDPDGDGLVTGIELRLGTDPLARDTNGDGIDDGTAVKVGTSATDPDVDHDGLTNAQEIALGIDPFRPDTDGDGVMDGADAAPLDPMRSTATPNPADHTPPSVTVTQPADARVLP